MALLGERVARRGRPLPCWIAPGAALSGARTDQSSAEQAGAEQRGNFEFDSLARQQFRSGAMGTSVLVLYGARYNVRRQIDDDVQTMARQSKMGKHAQLPHLQTMAPQSA